MPVHQKPTDQHGPAVSGNHQANGSSVTVTPREKENRANGTQVPYKGMKSQEHCCVHRGWLSGQEEGLVLWLCIMNLFNATAAGLRVGANLACN